MYRTHDNKMLVALIIAVFTCGFLVQEAAATQILVNGGVSIPPGYIENDNLGVVSTYLDVTTTASSLSGSAAIADQLGLARSSWYLDTGELNVISQSSPTIQRYNFVFAGSVGSANVSIHETVHISGNISSPVTGFLIADLDGNLFANALYENTFLDASAVAFFQMSVNNDPGEFDNYVFQTTGCPSTLPISGQFCINTNLINTEISIPFEISDAQRDFSFNIFLGSSSFGGGTVNLSNTAALGLILPNGLTFTSDSGVFLSQLAVGQVPEPSSMLLFGSGLIGLAVFLRR